MYKNLYDKLVQHDMDDIYPFHMPGHKRNSDKSPNVDPYTIDITEIDGFDDLNYAEGCLLEAEVRASNIFHTDNTYFLVNGCTGGLLAAVSVCCRYGDSILVARNCHKSVYNAIIINGLKPVYLWTENYMDYEDICGAISVESVRKKLNENKNIKCVVITSPTYEGVVSDVKGIVEVVHEYGIPVIIDEAHGSHMRFSDIFPPSANDFGADIVIHGIHKTLPSFTQTALLHLNGKMIDKSSLERNLSMFQTSSPSYVLMGSIDYCIDYLSEKSKDDFYEYSTRLERLYLELDNLKNLYVLPYSVNREASKIVICTDKCSIDGAKLYNALLEQFGLQPEMAAREYVIMMTSVWDTSEAFERLIKALYKIDGMLVQKNYKKTHKNLLEYEINTEILIRPKDAIESSVKRVKMSEAVGMISAEMIYVYPPGIPLIVPGEKITKQCEKIINDYKSRSFKIKGFSDKTEESILVIHQ